MMKSITKFYYLLATILVLSAPVVSAEDSPHEFSANVALTSNYMYRGVTQTNEGPALQGGFDYTYSSESLPFSFYAGVWASNVEFNISGNSDDSSIEIDYYGGLSGEFPIGDGLSWDIGALYYHYPDQNEDVGADYDFLEFYGNLGYTLPLPLDPTLGFGLAYSDDFFGEDDESLYPTGTLDLSLPFDIGLAFLIGHLDVDGDKTTGPAGFSYTHWTVGLSKSIGIFTLDATYYDADDDCADEFTGNNDLCEAVVFTISSSF
jgi:uncharacterized protein (TIGR02001 family)